MFVQDQLAALDGLSARSMFGGYGLYAGEIFFGIVHDGRLYLKTDAQSRREHEAAGMGPFRPRPGQILQRYWEVPAEVLEDAETLTAWARRALRCADG
ncbi:MAG: TfoX/Sxy family protein [Gammaproteobacteria bacterium]|nr:TfoX/Sxy family protein [Gammaproteobacteria bacterium]